MSDTEHRERAVTAMMRHLLRMDFTGLADDAFAAAFIEQLTAALPAQRFALLLQDAAGADCVFAVGLEADRAQLEADETLLWARDAATGAAFAAAAVDGEVLETALAVFASALERRRGDQRLAHDAFHDALTGLPNRALFIEHLDRAIERGRRASGYLFSVLFIDLDRFKVVNDSLGHDAGDQLLIGFAQRLRRAVRGGDVVARLGGDEFAVLADDLSELNDVLQMAHRVRDELHAQFEFGEQSVVINASMGIARNAPRYDHGAEMLRDADIAMHRAKQAGGGTHRMFDSEMHAAMVTRMQVESDLHGAVDGDQLRLAYQPIIRVADGALEGFEALLRWRHPTRGTILPGEFVGVAEETGMIVPIGRWVLTEVCRRLAAVNRGRGRPVSISVNLSDREFLQPGLVDEIDRALRDSDVDPACLHLELTERMLLANPRIEPELLPRLKELGVRIMIDDFGTGYSSLSRLQGLPIDCLKIDYSFIRELGNNAGSAEIVRAIVALAHNLGICVVAEGVERMHQLEMLQEARCDFAQGYLFSEPLEDRGLAPVLEREVWLPA